MPESTRFTLRSLRGVKRMPVPEEPLTRDYGAQYVGDRHDVMIFPAALRDRGSPKVDAIIEEGQSSCFFHPKLPATAICGISGRMICDLCQTEWNGQTVSFEALQSETGKKGRATQPDARTRWDNIALALAILPILLWFVTLLTAPATLFLVLWKGRKGPYSLVQRSGWRFLLAGVLALLQIVAWIYLFLAG